MSAPLSFVPKLKLKQALTGACLLTTSALTHGQVADLNTVYNMALANDAAFASQLAIYQSQELILPQVRAALLPNVSLDANQRASETPVQIDDQEFDPSTRSHMYGLVASQPLFDLGAWYAYEGAKSTVVQAQYAFIEAEQNLILDVANHYFSILNAKDQLRFAEAEKRALAQQLEQIQQQYEVGLVAITNVYQAQAAYDSQVAAVISAENTLANDWEDLFILIGPNSITNLYMLNNDFTQTTPSPGTSNPWVERSLTTNPTIVQARYQVDISESEVNFERAKRWPTLNLEGGWGQRRFGSVTGPDGPWEEEWSYRINARISLFSGFGTTASIQQAQYTQISTEDLLVDTERVITRDVRNSYRDVVTSISQTDAYHQAVCSAQESLKATEAGYEVGTQTVVDVLTEISNLYEQESNYVTARYDYIIALLELKSSTGVLSYDDLDEINEWLILPVAFDYQTEWRDCTLSRNGM